MQPDSITYSLRTPILNCSIKWLSPGSRESDHVARFTKNENAFRFPSQFRAFFFRPLRPS